MGGEDSESFGTVVLDSEVTDSSRGKGKTLPSILGSASASRPDSGLGLVRPTGTAPPSFRQGQELSETPSGPSSQPFTILPSASKNMAFALQQPRLSSSSSSNIGLSITVKPMGTANRTGKDLWKLVQQQHISHHQPDLSVKWQQTLSQLMIPANWGWLWRSRKDQSVRILEKLQKAEDLPLEDMRAQLQSTLYSLRQRKHLDNQEQLLLAGITSQLRNIDGQTRQLHREHSQSVLDGRGAAAFSKPPPITGMLAQAAASENEVQVKSRDIRCGFCGIGRKYASEDSR